MDPFVTAIVCAIIFVGSVVRSSVGFGEALIAMPLLAFVVPPQVAAPLVAVVSSFNAILILIREWRHISFRETAALTIAALIGIPLGAWLLDAGDTALIRGLLALVVIGFAGWSLSSNSSLKLNSDRSAPFFGLVSGILGGAYNTAGPPLVIFGTLRQWPAERFRANLQSYFLLGGSTVLAMHIYHGRVTEDVLLLSAYCIPLTIVAAWLGHRLTTAMPVSRFVRIVHVCLMLIGLLLLGTVCVEVLSA